MKFKLRAKYSLTFISLILIIVLVLSGTLLFRFKNAFGDLANTSSQIMSNELLEQMKNRGTVIAQLLVDNLINPVYLNDMAKIQILLQSVINQKNISFVYVYDADGKILHDGTISVELFGKPISKDIVLQANDLKNKSISQINGSILEVAQAIRLDDILLGGVVLGLDLDEIFENIEKMSAKLDDLKTKGDQQNLAFLILLTIALIILGVILSIPLAGRLIRPIKEVTTYAKKVGQGSYDFELLSPYEDEIGDLVQAFNRMKTDLKKTTISIHELESQVENRTQEIKKANETLLLEISIRKKVEQELVKHREKLEALVSQRTVDLEASNENLKKEIEERIHAEEQREKMQFQLKQAQKMEAIGTLAGGVAHDLNNILSGIISYPEMLLIELPKDSPHREAVEHILDSGKKAASVVHDLLTLARRGVEVKEIVNLKEIVRQYLQSPEFNKMISYHPGVTVQTELSDDWLGIIGSPVHLHKALMNLITNAAESMPKGGEIQISLKKQNLDTSLQGHPTSEKGEYISLGIADNGIGIGEKDIEKIYDPFFTKKTMDRSGTGLGLSVVWATVKDHSGFIDVTSTLGKGTKFEIHFPAIPKEIKKKIHKKTIDEYNGTEKILVADDLINQRKIATSILSKRGYEVVSVSSGEEAVEYMKKNFADLLLLDMIMKDGMDGLDTYINIKALHPNQKAIIVSGFTENNRINQAMKQGVGAFLKKPYLMEELLKCVRQVLNQYPEDNSP